MKMDDNKLVWCGRLSPILPILLCSTESAMMKDHGHSLALDNPAFDYKEESQGGWWDQYPTEVMNISAIEPFP